MRKLLTLLFLLCFTNLLSAQNRLTVVMDTKPVGSVIRLSKYLGALEIPLDSLRYRGEQKISFDYDSRYTDGVYVLEVADLEAFQFVLIDKQNLTAHIYESGSGMAFKPDMSKENDAFNIMLNLSDVYTKSMDSLSIGMQNLSEFDPRYNAISDSLQSVYERVANAYNNSLGLLNNLFPESYTSEVLVQLDKIPLRGQKEKWQKQFDNDAAFNHVHFFHYIDFSDERIITNPFLTNKVMEYLYSYTERSEQGIKEAIDKLLNQQDIHPKVQAFIIDLLIDFFSEKEASNFIDYINRAYLGNCELPLSEETMKKLKEAVVFNPGDELPNVKIPGETGHEIPLTALSGKLNVLVFWASWCPHCMREIPKLKTLHNQMQGDLGVYAISVDTSKTEWISAIRENNLNWINANDLQGWNSEHLETFRITSTPTLVLLDADLRWIGRASSYEGLYELVKGQLEQ